MSSNLRSMLFLIYRRIAPETVITNIARQIEPKFEPIKYMYSAFGEEQFSRPAKELFSYYSTDQISALLKEVSAEVQGYWRNDIDSPKELAKIGNLNVFELLNYYTRDVLVETDEGIVCEFSRLLGWRDITHLLSEDLFTTSFLAKVDVDHGRERYNFSWPDVVKTNNMRLNILLQRGLADNHFHLNASNPVFDIKWVLMMNHIFSGSKSIIKRTLCDYDEKWLSANVETFSHPDKRLTMYQLAYRAAVIRAILCKWVNNESFIFFEQLFKKERFQELCSQLNSEELTTEEQDKFYNFYNRYNAYPYFDPFVNEDIDYLQELEKEKVFSKEKLAKINLDKNIRGLHIVLKETVRAYSRRFLLDFLGGNSEYLEDIYDTEMSSYISRNSMVFNSKSFDYAMPNNFIGDEQHFLDGERRLMYDLFKRSFTSSNDIDKQYLELFYLYLLIKIRIRQEMVQSNDRYGFDNFSLYQDRKDDMFYNMPQNRLYRYYYAINNLFNNENVKSLELRLIPPGDVPSLSKRISEIEKVVAMDYHPSNLKPETNWVVKNSEGKLVFNKNIEAKDVVKERGDESKSLLKDNTYYVLHFPKKDDITTERFGKYYGKYDDNDAVAKLLKASKVPSRHHEHREYLRKTADVIIKLRETHYLMAKKILGIDACSNELNCRPEVFAPAFRYLSNHLVEKNSIFQSLDPAPPQHSLKMTYHVGEDFYDIIDGLRAIDEAIRFLNLRDGSRVGHALALGINARKWYTSKNNVIILPIQNMIDNLAWMCSRIRKYGSDKFAPFCERIERDFERFYDNVYGLDGKEAVTIKRYFDSWRLRGHDPSLVSGKEAKDENGNKYYEYTINKNPIIYCEYDKYLFNSNYGTNASNAARGLFYRYHYDTKAKVMGTKNIRYDITNDYIAVVEQLQIMMQQIVADRRIGIETNPSSNILISRIDGYHEHPLQNLYPIKPNDRGAAQNFVSINTDDKGVFNTCIENEYALIACAMGEIKDSDSNALYSQSQILDWLDEIRVMGLEQSFVKVDLTETLRR